MKILERRAYRGPNRYARWPVIRLLVDLEELEETPTGRLPGFPERLLETLPGLWEHGCSLREPGGFVRRMTEGEGTWMGHVLEHVALELQGLAGAGVTFGKTRGRGLPRGRYHVIYSVEDEQVGRWAAELALRLLLHLLPGRAGPAEADPFDFDRELRAFLRRAEARKLGPTTAALARAAEERDVPWERVGDGSLLRLGQGRHQQWIEAAVTGRTRLIAGEIASDKRLTHRLLSERGLPVPEQAEARDAEEAVAAAESVGYPVVVKPLDGNHGRAVSVRLTTPEAVRAAFERAAEVSRLVLVESYQPGHDYRVLVVDGRAVAVAQRLPGGVVGDGRHTVAELVERENADPRRGEGHDRPLTRLELDEQALRLLGEGGLSPGSVPAAGRIVPLRATANLSTGGTAIDRTDEIHPDNRTLAERAAAAVGLDVAGVDLVSPDISRSWREAAAAIVEVNAGPGFRMHLFPSQGAPRDVAGPVLDMLFPPGAPARIPIAAITGTNGKTTTARMVGHILGLAGYRVGMTTTDGIYLDGELQTPGDRSGPESARRILSDPQVDAAVLETARGGLLRAGLGFDRCDVAAVLNVAGDHLGLDGVETLDDLAKVKRLIVEVARNHCVLNADDERVAAMADYGPGEPTFVSLDPHGQRLRGHIRRHGRAVILDGVGPAARIVLFEGGHPVPLLEAQEIPCTLRGRARHNLQNAMFAAAIAHALGVPLERVRLGLRTFDATFERAPGRFNLYEGLPFGVLLDYAHNPHALEAIGRTVRSLPVAGRRVCVLAGVGDRRDQDLQRLGRVAARYFDEILLREDADLRGRAPGETAGLLRAGLLAAGFPPERIAPGVYREEEAVERALGSARPGDFVVILAEKTERTWRQIGRFEEAARAEVLSGTAAERPGALAWPP